MDVVKVEKRNERMKARQLRKAGVVPCSVYGGLLKEAIALQMDEPTARWLARKKRVGSRLELELEGRRIPVQIKEKQENRVTDVIEHISFQALAADQKVNSVAHILLKHAEAVPGVLEQMIFAVPFSSLPADMIDTVTIDVEGMTEGTVVTLGEIPEFRNERIELQLDPGCMVLRVSEKRREVKPAAPEEESGGTEETEPI